MQKNIEANLKSKIEATNAFPQYMKDIYLKKISDKKYSQYWLKKVDQTIDKLEKVISSN